MMFQLDDPVQIERDSQNPLEGIVAHVGPVKFEEGDDWVGVRLTGSSIGEGKNDGSVQGEEYFSCDMNCGVFVRAARVSRRTLSKLEEVRLKRELKLSNAKYESPTRGQARRKNSLCSIGETPETCSGNSTVATTATETPGRSFNTRLDEIRARRLAILEGRSYPPSLVTSRVSPSSSQASSHDRSTANDFQNQINILFTTLSSLQRTLEYFTTKLKEKEVENDVLEQKLEKAQQALEEFQNESKNLEKNLQSDHQAALERHIQDFQSRETEMRKEISELQTSCMAIQSELNSTHKELAEHREAHARDVQDLTVIRSDVDNSARDLKKEREAHAKTIQDLIKAKSELVNVQLELANLDVQELMKIKEEEDSLKREGNEEAQNKSLQDALHQSNTLLHELRADKGRLENEILDLNNIINNIMSEKATVNEGKDLLEKGIKELKLENRNLQQKNNTLKSELEKTVENRNQSDPSINVLSPEAQKELIAENSRLRTALHQLQKDSSAEKVELVRRLRVAEECVSKTDSNSVRMLQHEVKRLQQSKVKLEEEINFFSELCWTIPSISL
jgi:dynactin 1